MRQEVRQGLVASLNPQLVDELLIAHQEAKRNYYLNDRARFSCTGNTGGT